MHLFIYFILQESLPLTSHNEPLNPAYSPSHHRSFALWPAVIKLICDLWLNKEAKGNLNVTMVLEKLMQAAAWLPGTR